MGVTVWRAEDSWDTLVAVAIIEEIVINREEGGAAWWRTKNEVNSTANARHPTKHTHKQAGKHKSHTRICPSFIKSLLCRGQIQERLYKIMLLLSLQFLRCVAPAPALSGAADKAGVERQAV